MKRFNKNNLDTTLVIISYKSMSKVLEHIQIFYGILPIIIIDNYGEEKLESEINNKFSNVKYFKKNNLGYGRAINFAAKYINTKYFFVINPDLKISLEQFLKFERIIQDKELKFFAIGPNIESNLNQNLVKYSKLLSKVKDINGSAMFFCLQEFIEIGGFDEKIFLFFEEADINLRAIKFGKNLFVATDIQCAHMGSSSFDSKDKIEVEKLNHLLAWHGEWSRYYFYQKHYGIIFALIFSFQRMLKNFIQFSLNCIFRKKEKSLNYKYRLQGMINSMLGRNSHLRIEFIRVSNKNGTAG
tara:strand:- start:26 stop:922 length:897 start_codon:yes stop_codon:yes gene_type:complete